MTKKKEIDLVQAVLLKSRGVRMRDIAKMFGCAKSTLEHRMRQQGLTLDNHVKREEPVERWRLAMP